LAPMQVDAVWAWRWREYGKCQRTKVLVHHGTGGWSLSLRLLEMMKIEQNYQVCIGR